MKNYNVTISKDKTVVMTMKVESKSEDRAIATAEKKFKAKNKIKTMDGYDVKCDQILDEVTTELHELEETVPESIKPKIVQKSVDINIGSKPEPTAVKPQKKSDTHRLHDLINRFGKNR